MTTKAQQRLQEKLQALKDITLEYSKYLDNWNKVRVDYDEFTSMVSVTWYNEVERQNSMGETDVYYPYTRREFHSSDLTDRITSYRNKIKYALSKEEKDAGTHSG